MAWVIPITIIILLFYGVIPIISIIEVSHWIFKKNSVDRPVITGAVVGLFLGLSVIIYLASGASGEAGFAAIILIPFLFIGFIILGTCIGSCYEIAGRTICINKPFQKTRLLEQHKSSPLNFAAAVFSHFISILVRNFGILSLLFVANFMFCSNIYFLGPYRGRVVDAETGDPLEGALVFANINTSAMNHEDSSYAGHRLTFTGEDGNFKLSKVIFVFRPLTTWERADVQVFKPGYGTERYHSPGLKSSDAAIKRWNIETIELQKLKTAEEVKANLLRIDIPQEITGREKMVLQVIEDIERMKISRSPLVKTLEEYERIIESGELNGEKITEYSTYELVLWRQFGEIAEKYRKKKPEPVVITDPYRNCNPKRVLPPVSLLSDQGPRFKPGQSLIFPFDCAPTENEKNNSDDNMKK